MKIDEIIFLVLFTIIFSIIFGISALIIYEMYKFAFKSEESENDDQNDYYP